MKIAMALRNPHVFRMAETSARAFLVELLMRRALVLRLMGNLEASGDSRSVQPGVNPGGGRLGHWCLR